MQPLSAQHSSIFRNERICDFLAAKRFKAQPHNKISQTLLWMRLGWVHLYSFSLSSSCCRMPQLDPVPPRRLNLSHNLYFQPEHNKTVISLAIAQLLAKRVQIIYYKSSSVTQSLRWHLVYQFSVIVGLLCFIFTSAIVNSLAIVLLILTSFHSPKFSFSLIPGCLILI